ncbi:MAG TPA: glycerol-3-phosphate dehydrogenase/oxidase [Spirochaetota bacterium]|nr:glycerol-3-phosphate dehydrogenase/oxidase [Spirochaetota bacterium]HOS38223.1 glycerol-3-phosphate dehydrogenase/oxidase [Spirochaetota bacterium]HPU87682.1 glycerol-3-phosphate dehydrogenase/oxidase [Spirochaetota bacterium]
MERFLDTYRGARFDIIVVGGGITGAAVAYEAASRGLSVALLEKNDFGWATSAATSKMIHGGLRYLNNFELGLVRESLRERRILENIAPNLVYPFPLLIPNYKKLMTRKSVLNFGLTLYDILAFDKKRTWDPSKRIPNHSTYSRDKTRAIAPGVKTDGLTGSCVFYDCRSIFPERLTLAFVRSAMRYGAKAANYATVTGFVRGPGGRIAGVTVKDTVKRREMEIHGELVVNCGGPWADIVLNTAKGGANDHPMKRSEGIHIITKKLYNEHAVTLQTPEGRHFFILPWRNHALIGTTDKEFFGSPDDYRVSRQSVQELIDEVNQSYGDGTLSYDDVLFAYGGLRPLVEQQTAETYESSRKYEIHDNAEEGFEGLITVEGGKYTTSRNLADNVLKMVKIKLHRSLTTSITDRIYLHGCEIKDLEEFVRQVHTAHADFPKNTREYLARNYGTECHAVFDIARENTALAQPVNGDGEILAQVAYAARREMALTLNDILFRRTGLGTLGDPGAKVLNAAAKVAAKELRWNAARVKKEIAAAKKALALPA